jgi:hypothetical protein
MTYYDSSGKRWYYSLKPNEEKDTKGMFDYESRKSLLNKLIIVFITKDGSMLFTSFDDHIKFYEYQNKLQDVNRCFFEEILGESQQKLYFDLDINLLETPDMPYEDVKDDLIIAILNTFASFGITLQINRDILVCTSHSDIKKSYHVIVDNHCLPNCEHNKALYQIVKSKLNPAYKHPDDLYKSLQQFRILGSQKRGSGRPKVFLEKWSLRGIPIEYEYPDDLTGDKKLYQLSRTLISNTTNCKVLPYVSINDLALVLNKSQRMKKFEESQIQISSDIALKAFNKLIEFSGMNQHDPKFPYKYNKIVNNMVLLKRIKPSQCRICNVIHENQDPFLFINKVGNVYFDCRRSTEHGDGIHKTLPIGTLDGFTYKQTKLLEDVPERIEDERIDDEDEFEFKGFNLNDMNFSSTLIYGMKNDIHTNINTNNIDTNNIDTNTNTNTNNIDNTNTNININNTDTNTNNIDTNINTNTNNINTNKNNVSNTGNISIQINSNESKEFTQNTNDTGPIKPSIKFNAPKEPEIIKNNTRVRNNKTAEYLEKRNKSKKSGKKLSDFDSEDGILFKINELSKINK